MDYLKIEGGKISGLRTDDGEDLALMQGAPRILLRSGVPILQLFCQREAATINNPLGSHTLFGYFKRGRECRKQAVLTNTPIPSTSEIPAPSSRLSPTIGDCPRAC